MKNRWSAWLAVLLLASLLAGCAPPPAAPAPQVAPQQVEVTRVVEKQVPVEVTRVVEKVVEKEVPAAAPAAPESVKLEVLSPAGQAAGKAIKFAKRVDTLDGKTVALHWNGKPGGEFLLWEIKDRLAAKYKDIKFVDWPKGTAWEADVAKNMKDMPADVAILSVGD